MKQVLCASRSVRGSVGPCRGVSISSNVSAPSYTLLQVAHNSLSNDSI